MATQLPASELSGLLQTHAALKSRRLALGFALLLIAITAAAGTSNAVHGPVILSFVPMTATLWCTADLLTSYLLFSQLRVSGDVTYLVIGSAYFGTGLLSIPYIIFFPGTIGFDPTVESTAQISVTLWAAWHIGFPVLIGGFQLLHRRSAHTYLDRAQAPRLLKPTLLAALAGVTIIVGWCVYFRASLPILVVGSHFSGLFSAWITPAIVAANLLAALVVVTSAAQPSTLQLWLAVALLSAAADGFLNSMSSGRYSMPWFVGKLETIITASLLLVVLLNEVSKLYAGFGRLALFDSLTGLRNRRAFDDYCALVIGYARRSGESLAFLIVDVDFFKFYNDEYGHAAGDECLRRVADAMRLAVSRENDIAGRYGGEEFVVVLPVTALPGAIEVADRIRTNVEALQIPHKGSTASSVVTVSIGVCATIVDRETRSLRLYERADKALYEAKLRRNSVSAREYADQTTETRLLTPGNQ